MKKAVLPQHFITIIESSATFSFTNTSCNTSEPLSSCHCWLCTWEMSDLEPLHSPWTMALLWLSSWECAFSLFDFGREDMKHVPRYHPSYQTIKMYGMIPSQTYLPVTGRLDMAKLFFSFFSKIFNGCS